MVADVRPVPVRMASVSRMSPRLASCPTPVVRPRLAAAVVLAGLPFLTIACGETGKISVSDAAPASTSTTDATTTTGDEMSTTEGTTDASTTTASASTGNGSTGGSATAADEESTDASWTASPGEYRGQDGLKVAYTCPPGGTLNTIWGTGPFTDDSSVCTAAVYAGLITTEGGGRVVIVIAPGESTYAGGEANGVTASEYGTWAGSYTFA